MALQIHLPNRQYVVFEEGNEADTVAEGPKPTELTGFFDYNAKHPNTAVRYVDFPKNFVWMRQTGEWKPRVQGGVIERIHTIHPLCGDEFYLRMLLNHDHCKGKTSYTDLITLNDHEYSTYKEVCSALGILQDDNEWEQALAEADFTRSCPQIRALFVTILLYCEPTSPLQLYENHKANWADDFRHKYTLATEIQLEHLILLDLETKLQEKGKRLDDFGLPTVTQDEKEEIATLIQNHVPLNRSVVEQEETDFDLTSTITEKNNRVVMLTQSQRAVYDRVMGAIQNSEPLALFMDARGRTGKTYTLNTILAAARTLDNTKKIAFAVASSGIAATLLKLGRIFHSRFKVPLNPTENVTFSIKPTDKLAKVIAEADFIVWNEAPMMHRHVLEGLDRVLRDITQVDTAFGGKILVLAGDFRQILPVIVRGSRAQITDACLKKSKLWRLFEIMQLKENMRIGNDPDFQVFDNWLQQLDNGQLPITEKPDTIRLPESSVTNIDDSDATTIRDSMNTFIDIIFPSIGFHFDQPVDHWLSWISERAILAPENSEVDRLNEVIINRFPGADHVACSADCTTEVNDATRFLVEYLKSLTPTGMPPHQLILKPGIVLMLLRNLNPRQGLCNGTRLIL